MECYKCGKHGHYAKECRSANCYNCGKYGHIAKYCRAKSRSEEKEKNLLTEEEDEEAGILMMTQNSETKLRLSCASEVELNLSCVERSTVELPSSDEKSEAEIDSGFLNNSIWYLDTRASNHMCGEESFFNELIKVKAGFVSFGDDSKVAVKGHGTIKHMQEDGRVGEIRNVYYVPELKNNILSMGQMMEKGNSILMKDRVLYLKDKHDRLIVRVEMKKNRMYKLELNILLNKCLKLDVKDETMMWHFRFGHLNFEGLAELSRKELVHGLRGVEFDKKFCEACVLEKHSRTSFPSSSEYKAKEQLGLIHTDLCGPISSASFSGKKYFISFIDDFSRKTWVYFLQEKSKAFEAFKRFKVMVEKETNKQIKALRSDRGGEFTSAEFMEYCEEQGTKRFLTAPYSPQQNGVAERKNRTILDMVRAMLKGKNMPEKFWAEAV